jgi:phosphomannomutase
VGDVVASAPRYVIVKAKLPRPSGALEPWYQALGRRLAGAALDRQDGLRLTLPDRWLHVRPSGTEPVVRIIAEAPDRAAAEGLVERGRAALRDVDTES